MQKDHLERKSYRKSPGRQYGYDYDPLRSQSGSSQSGSTVSRPGTMLVQRPDPRRTRQLLRQSIIASKRSTYIDEDDETFGYDEIEPHYSFNPPSTPSRSPKVTRRIHQTYGEYRSQHPRSRHPSQVEHDDYIEDDPQAWEQAHLPAHDGYNDYEDPYQEQRRTNSRRPQRDLRTRIISHDDLDEDVIYEERPSRRPPTTPLILEDRPSRRPKNHDAETTIVVPDEDRIYEEDEELPAGAREVKKPRRLSRRGLLIGAGAIAVGGAGVAAVAALPKVPEVGEFINDTQEAFNRGVQEGAENARQELLKAFNTIEGFSLDSAVGAAQLTRVAYDVFVSPVINFGSGISGDFLKAMLEAFKEARGWLAGIYQDNATLIAIQKVLEAWVDQVEKLPKQIDAITQTDLDGAQAYLRALKRKLEEEEKKLNSAQETPTALPAASPTATAPAAPQTTPTANPQS